MWLLLEKHFTETSQAFEAISPFMTMGLPFGTPSFHFSCTHHNISVPTLQEN